MGTDLECELALCEFRGSQPKGTLTKAGFHTMPKFFAWIARLIRQVSLLVPNGDI